MPPGIFFGVAVAFPSPPLHFADLFIRDFYFSCPQRPGFPGLHAHSEIPTSPCQHAPQSPSGLQGAIKGSPMMFSSRSLATAKLSALSLGYVHIL